jgi:hypothetical protein
MLNVNLLPAVAPGARALSGAEVEAIVCRVIRRDDVYLMAVGEHAIPMMMVINHGKGA